MHDTNSPLIIGQQSWFRQGPNVPHSRSRVQRAGAASSTIGKT